MYDQAPFEGRAEADLVAYTTYDIPYGSCDKSEQDFTEFERRYYKRYKIQKDRLGLFYPVDSLKDVREVTRAINKFETDYKQAPLYPEVETK